MCDRNINLACNFSFLVFLYFTGLYVNYYYNFFILFYNGFLHKPFLGTSFPLLLSFKKLNPNFSFHPCLLRNHMINFICVRERKREKKIIVTSFLKIRSRTDRESAEPFIK